MAKCVKCSKLVSKRNAGLQCGACNKWIHATCASLSNEQLAALSATDAIWKCRNCTGTKPKRVSIILPDRDPEEDDVNSVDNENTLSESYSGQIITEIRRQIKDVMKDEFKKYLREAIQEELKRCLQFYSDKIDDFQECIEKYEEKMKSTENENKELKNKYTHIKNKVELLEQKLQIVEQTQMGSHLEVCGIPKTEDENLREVMKKVAEKIQQDSKDILMVYRKESKARAGQKRNASTLVVTLREGRRDSWLDSAKTATITGQDIDLEEAGRIFMREALTPSNAFLLWKAKSELKATNICKYVWCRRGCILVKKDDTSKTYPIRSVSDIEHWTSTFMNRKSE